MTTVAERSTGRRRGRGRREVVAPAEFTSYYQRPIVKEPTWAALDIAGYFFLGGLAGASSVLAATADACGCPRLARASKVGALGAISLSMVGLIHDLGRPARFVNMLRVIKPTSPMSVGSWLLGAYGPASGAAALSSVTGLLPGVGQAGTLGAALLGSGVATYTAAIIADTAVPAWHDGYREMPFVFMGSAAAAAGGLGMLAAPTAETAPARHSAALGAAVELGAMRLMERHLGLAAETLHQGTAGRLLRTSELLTLAGLGLGLGPGRRHRLLAAAGGAGLLAASICTRFGIFQAGVASTRDPKYVVVPQRQRLAERERAGG